MIPGWSVNQSSRSGLPREYAPKRQAFWRLLWEFCAILTAFVGLNMTQAAFTGFCPLAMVLKKLETKPGCAFC
ncbi:YgaP family membrane protein [Insolitispirillum peregrinum]|uniref:YgaP family membrane protein n=1 Tax=Insolitispirillum peregrinum TaxID=80876 RepID=UPI00360760BE